MPDLTRKSSRERLKIRREPYWQRLTEGAYLGFRRGPDTWIGRYRDRDRKQVYQALHGALEYDDAKKAAETWLQQMGSAMRTVRRGTVREALEAYLDHLRQQGRDAAAKTSEQRFKAIVWPDELASIRLHALVRQDMTAWRSRLQVGRQNRSVDRHVRSVVAGLNKAVELGHIGNPLAWKLEKLADDVADGGETAVILTPEHRKALIGAAIPEAALFFRALELTGARPGEVAAAKVSDLDTKQGILILRHRKGRPPKLRPRAVDIFDGVEFFKKQAKSKLPDAYLFTMANGRPWERHDWADEIRAAIKKHNTKARGAKRLPVDASAYSFRHARISELLQVHHIDPLTVAMQTGTSVKMIEQAYFKFIPSAMRDKLRAAS